MRQQGFDHFFFYDAQLGFAAWPQGLSKFSLFRPPLLCSTLHDGAL
jgi:hypothetical protein